MAGGELNYIYRYVEDAGVTIKRYATTPTLKAFGKFVIEFSKVLKDVELALSDDISISEAENSIRKLNRYDSKTGEYELLITEGKEIIKQLSYLIEEKHVISTERSI